MQLISDLLDDIAAISGRNDKISRVARVLADYPETVRVFTLALNPLTSFGFNSIPPYQPSNMICYDLHMALDKVESLTRVNHSQATIDLLTDVLEHTTDDVQQIVKRVVLKDLKCGVQLSTFNKAVDLYNKLYTDKLDCKIADYPCMLASAYKSKLINKIFANNDRAYCQLKCDGARFNAIVRGSTVTLFGRSGKQLYIEDPELISQFVALANGHDVVYDGELLVDVDSNLNALDRKTGNGIINRAVRATITPDQAKRISAVIWDRIDIKDFEAHHSDVDYQDRFTTLQSEIERVDDRLTRIHLVPNWIVTNNDQCIERFNQMIELGREGVIVKSPTNKWSDVRATDCVKFKQEKECDLLVISDSQITNGKPMVGSVTATTSDNRVVVGVGSGFTEQERLDYFGGKLVGKIITVKYNEMIVDKNSGVYSLFLPRFVEVREDKTIADSIRDIAAQHVVNS